MGMVFFVPPSQRRLALLAAQADMAPVLVCGASGTGKGAIVQWLHNSGPRAGQPFVEFSPKTNATQTSLIDQLQLAQGGTLVIHHVDALSTVDQKFLRELLETRSVSLPGLRLLTNVRVITTSDESPHDGSHFLSFIKIVIEMPALKNRLEEFEEIALEMLGEITRNRHLEHIRTIASAALLALRDYSWPGNIRELRNVLQIAVANAKTDEIQIEDLPDLDPSRSDLQAKREQFEKIYQFKARSPQATV